MFGADMVILHFDFTHINEVWKIAMIPMTSSIKPVTRRINRNDNSLIIIRHADFLFDFCSDKLKSEKKLVTDYYRLSSQKALQIFWDITDKKNLRNLVKFEFFLYI